MKYLKTFEDISDKENFNPVLGFDEQETSKGQLDLAIKRIKDEYSDDEVAANYDDEIMNWVDSDWEDDGYDSEYDWYIDHNNGEAQDVVIGEMINWYKRTYDKDISVDDCSDLFDEIKSEYGLE
jgi:elongation factor P--beta-lysine ligase